MLILFSLLLLGLALAVLMQERLLNAVILLGVFSLLSSVIYFLVGAPDVAVTEGAIGVAFVTFIYVLALSDQGKLHVIAEEVPPFLFQEKGELQGLELELLRGFAKEVNLELEVEFVASDELNSLIGGRRADVIAGAYFPGYIPEQDLNNTRSFNKAQLSRVVCSEMEGRRTGILPEVEFLKSQKGSEIDMEEESPFKVGEMRRITRHQDLEQEELVRFNSLDRMVDAYNRGEIGAFVADSGRVSNALYKINTPLREKSQIVALGEVEYGFAVSSDESDLLGDLDGYLERLERSDRISELLDKYLR
ncbi:transporter substrate-binding domain-containing protein [Candidatus Bipolaricaulota bacterium]|nr:transporter substrate-binding domain-containing protein [Candidatus Bipolaricaulota bacterium]